MDRPDSSGEVLRAIARAYRDEIGPARAEQLASRAIARAGERPHRYQRVGLLASSVPLAASLVVLGIGVLTGNSDSIAPVNSDPAPVVSGPEVSEGAQVPTLTKEGLLEALDLIDQQRELEAAEVVVEALSHIAESIPSEVIIEASGPPLSLPEEMQTPTTSPSVAGVLPSEQDIDPDDPPSSEENELTSGSENQAPAADPPQDELAADPPQDGPAADPPQDGLAADPPQDGTADPDPPIEELGQMLKLEVEELLGVLDVSESDPDALTDAVEGVEKAVAPILEYHSEDEPNILVPSSGDDEQDDTGEENPG